jgi:hypothetical protein
VLDTLLVAEITRTDDMTDALNDDQLSQRPTRRTRLFRRLVHWIEASAPLGPIPTKAGLIVWCGRGVYVPGNSDAV